MQISEITKYFKNIKKAGQGFTALCPAHEDKTNSLSIGQGESGKLLLHCHAGCSLDDILKAAGLKTLDIFPDEPKQERNVEAVYSYKDEKGDLLYEVIRYNPKGFSQRRPDGKGGYTYNLKNITPVLYRLPEVAEAIRQCKTIFIVEGEKDTENLYKLGFIATTCSSGAGKWRAQYSDSLKGANVVILPDNDEPGKKHAEQVTKSLLGKASSIKVVELPELSLHGDITDFFRLKGKQEGLKLLNDFINAAKDLNQSENSLSTIDAKTLKEKQLPPVIFTIDRLMSTGLSILAAPPKAGKSWLALWLCSQIAQGLPVWNRRTKQGTVLYLALEDSLNRIQQRLNALTDKTPENLHFAIEADAVSNGLEGQLQDFMAKHKNTVFIVIDTLQKVRQLRKNENAYATDYSDAGALKKFADNHGLSILVVHHTRKMADSDPFNTISGSTGLTGAADSMFVIQKQSRTSQEAVLHATGRDIDPAELMIRFDENKTWQLISDDATTYKEEQSVNENPLIILCKRFLEANEKFEGTATALHALLATQMNAGEYFRFSTNAQALSRELTALQPKLIAKGILFERCSDTSKRYLTLKKVPLVPLDSACDTENNSVTDTSAIQAQLNISLEASHIKGSSATSAIQAQPYIKDTPLECSNTNTSSAISETSANVFYISNLLDSALKESD